MRVPKCTLRAAIQLVNEWAKLPFIGQRPEYLIIVPPNKYPLNAGFVEDLGASGDLDIQPQTSVRISGAGLTTTVVVGNGERIFDVHHGAIVTISGLRISGGINRTNLQLGGGIRNAGTLNVIDSEVSDNIATNFTGGAGIGNSGVLTLTRTDVLRNDSDSHGGGILNALGTLTVVEGNINDNRATTSGAGLYNVGPATTIRRSTISGNRARRGAGITHAGNGALVIVNSTISGNVADFIDGSAIYGSAPVHLFHVTIRNNQLFMLNATARLRNTIIDVPGCAGPGAFISDGFNLDSGQTCKLTGTGDRSAVNPLLQTLSMNGGRTKTHAPGRGSLAIDAINEYQCAGCPLIDQRGVIRPRKGGVPTIDVGAYEAP
jgi:hypothetical protein